MTNASQRPVDMASAPTLRSLFQRLEEKGQLTEDEKGAILAFVARREEVDVPWYVQALIGLGSWVAAVSFIGFLVLAELLEESTVGFLAWGSVFLATAIGLNRKATGLFFSQLSLALVLSGKFLILAGVVESELFGMSEEDLLALSAVMITAATYRLFQSRIDRFVSVMVSFGTILAWIFESEAFSLLHVLLFLTLLGAGWLLTWSRLPKALEPLAYALSLGTLLTLSAPLISKDAIPIAWWPSRLILLVGLAVLYGWSSGARSPHRLEPVWVATVATAVLSVFAPPCVLAALALLVLGYARHDRILLSIGFGFLPFFIVKYYYDLDLNLFIKSGILICSGIFFLLAWAYVESRFAGRRDQA